MLGGAVTIALAFTTPALRQPQWRGAAHALTMKEAPLVPYKYPGSDIPQWINVFNRMYRERIIFIGRGIDDNFANNMIAVMLYLESEDAKSPCSMYFNVPGGITKAGLAMHDTMRMMPYDVNTVNMGIAAEIGAFLVASGTPGKRKSLPNARFYVGNPMLLPPRDNEGKVIRRPMQATEMELEVAEVLRDKERLLKGYSSFTGRSVEQIRKDLKRNFYLTAAEAVEYGLVDSVMTPKGQEKKTSTDDAKFGSYGSGDEQRFQDVVNTADAAAAANAAADAPSVAPEDDEPPKASALLRAY